jgi:hypothetical protein
MPTLSDISASVTELGRRLRTDAGATLVLEGFTEDVGHADLIELADGWDFFEVTDEATGQPVWKLLLTPREALTAELVASVHSLRHLGVRYERRSFDGLGGHPRRWRLTAQPVGEVA